MDGITIKQGVPHIWGIPCTRDANYKFSLAEYLGLMVWLCPFCDSHLCVREKQITCLNNCHVDKNSIKKQA